MTPAVLLALPLADQLPPPLRGGQFAATEIDAVPLILLLGAFVLYLWGVARANRLHPRHPWPWWRTMVFTCALVVTAVAVLSFIGVYDRVLFWDHMVQHLMLIMVASPLFAAGAPVRLALLATTGDVHDLLVRVLRSAPARILGNPIVAFVLYALVIPLTHLTSFYNYTLTHETVHDTEHLLYLVIGYLFWRQVFDGEPNEYRLQPGLKMLYLFLAIPIDTFTGLSLAGQTSEPFSWYLSMHRTWGPSLITDLHIGGTIMWVGGDTLMMLPLIPLALQWMHLEERRAERADRELDAAFAAAEEETASWAVPEEGGATAP